MGRCQQAIGGVVVGAMSVMIVGETLDIATPGSPARTKRVMAYAVPVLQPQRGTPDDEPHRESRGSVMLRYPTVVSSTSAVNVVTATVRENEDFRRLSVPISFKNGRFMFGQEFWSA